MSQQTTPPLSMDNTTLGTKANTTTDSKAAGRWTKEEHQAFVEALKLYGKNWKKVEEHVGTRSGAQIRSHAQKFFNRLQRDLGLENSPATSNDQEMAMVRKMSISSSLSTNNGYISDEDGTHGKKNAKMAVPVKKFTDERIAFGQPTYAKSLPQALSPLPATNIGHPQTHAAPQPAPERLAPLFPTQQPVEPTTTCFSIYETIMEKLRQFKKEHSDTLKLSDLVDMQCKKSYDYCNTFKVSSFRPVTRKNSFFFYGMRPEIEEPALRKMRSIDC